MTPYLGPACLSRHFHTLCLPASAASCCLRHSKAQPETRAHAYDLPTPCLGRWARSSLSQQTVRRFFMDRPLLKAYGLRGAKLLAWLLLTSVALPLLAALQAAKHGFTRIYDQRYTVYGIRYTEELERKSWSGVDTILEWGQAAGK